MDQTRYIDKQLTATFQFQFQKQIIIYSSNYWTLIVGKIFIDKRQWFWSNSIFVSCLFLYVFGRFFLYIFYALCSKHLVVTWTQGIKMTCAKIKNINPIFESKSNFQFTAKINSYNQNRVIRACKCFKTAHNCFSFHWIVGLHSISFCHNHSGGAILLPCALTVSMHLFAE